MAYFRIADVDVDMEEELSKLVVVVPTIRPEQLESFFDDWVHPSIPVRFVFVHDSPTLLDIPPGFDPDLVRHVCWSDIESHLVRDSWIIPRRSDCVRSYGFLVAQSIGASYVCSMDDDCRPPIEDEVGVRSFWEDHLRPICSGMVPTFSTTGDRLYNRPRGIPLPSEEDESYHAPLPVAMNHGLWNGVMDRSGRDEVELTEGGTLPVYLEDMTTDTMVVPRGFFYPMCGMNVCFRIEMLPAMYFGLQGQVAEPSGELHKLDYDRYGDIWAGMISKLAADLTGSCVTSGPPNVMHIRASNCLVNADKERRGIVLHPKLLRDVFGDVSHKSQSQLWYTGGGMVADVVSEVAATLARCDDGYDPDEKKYLDLWARALDTWVGLSVR